MKKILKSLAAAVLAVGLSAGAVGASSGSISGPTGPDSFNKVKISNHQSVHVTNNNDVNLSNSNDQHAYSGDAKVSHNTTGGSAKSGNATNSNSLNASLNIRNDGFAGTCGCSNGGSNTGTINGATGPDSTNIVKISNSSKVSVTNNNDISVSNTNDQHASTGDASVWGNTTGGSATSGNASNTNSTTFNLSVSN